MQTENQAWRWRTALSVLLVLIVVTGAVWVFRANAPESLAKLPEAVHTFGDETPVAVTTSMDPMGHNFQDPLQATIVLWVDTTRVNPESITFEQLDVEPYTAAEEFSRSIEVFGDVVRVTYTTTLRCLKAECLSVDGGPQAPQLKTVRIRYEAAEENNGKTIVHGRFLSAAWRPTAVLGRIDPATLLLPDSDQKSYDADLFDSEVIPPAPVFPMSEKSLQILILISALAAVAGIVLLLNPNIRVLPEKVDPALFIKKQREALAAEEARKTSTDYAREALAAFTANTESSDNVLYQLRNYLRDAGHTGLAEEVEQLNFGHTGDAAERDRLIRAIGDVLENEEGGDNG